MLCPTPHHYGSLGLGMGVFHDDFEASKYTYTYSQRDGRKAGMQQHGAEGWGGGGSPTDDFDERFKSLLSPPSRSSRPQIAPLASHLAHDFVRIHCP